MPTSVGDCGALALIVLCTLWPLLQPTSCMPANFAASDPAQGSHKGALLSGKDFLSVLVASRTRFSAFDASTPDASAPDISAPDASSPDAYVPDASGPSEVPTRVPLGLGRWGRRQQVGATPPAGTSLLEALTTTPPTPEGTTEEAGQIAEGTEAAPPTLIEELPDAPPEPTDGPEEPPTDGPEEPPTEPPPDVEERLPIVPDSLLLRETPLRPAFALPEAVVVEEDRVGLMPPDTASLEPPARRRDQKSLRRRYLLRHPPHDNAVHGGEPVEANYEVPEEVSVASRGRVHGPQSDPRQKFGYVVEGRNFRKYRVEERTADGFIVGEYGVLSHEGVLRGVRYTADGTISPRLIHEALVKFLSL